LKRTKAYPLLYEKKPDFDNEFLNVFRDQHDNIGIVYAVMTKDSKHDAIKSVLFERDFILGIEHFAQVSAEYGIGEE
jgi:hypothetical protein